MIIRLLLLPMTVCVLLQSACHKPAQRMSTPMAVQDDDRFNGDETIVRDWSFLGIKGQQIRTRHWDIRTTMQSERFKEILPAFYEMAMDQYQNAFDNYDNDVIKVIDHSLGTDGLNHQQLLSQQQNNNTYVDQVISMHTMTTPGTNTNLR